MRTLAAVVVLLALGLGGVAHAGRPKPKLNQKRVVLIAQKAPIVNCTLTEILATNEKKGIDPKLKKLEAKLTKPPFSAWDTFKLLAEPSVKAEKDHPASAPLATGGKITLLFKDKLVSQGGKARLRMGIDVDAKDGKRILSTVMVFGAGDVQFPVAGDPFDKGVYILALGCIIQ